MEDKAPVKVEAEGHGGTTTFLRSDCLPIAVGCSSACIESGTESCSARFDCVSVRTLNSRTYPNCDSNNGTKHNL